MARRFIKGVGVPTGDEINRSQAGFNQLTTPGEIRNPQLERQYDRKTLSVIDLDLGVALPRTQFKTAGTVLWYASAIDSAGAVLFDRPITIRFDRVSSDPITFLPGMLISGFPFDRLFIEHGAFTADDAGQLLISIDKPGDRIDVE